MATGPVTGSDGIDTSDRLARGEVTVGVLLEQLEERVRKLEAVNAKLKPALTGDDDHQVARGGEPEGILGNMSLNPKNRSGVHTVAFTAALSRHPTSVGPGQTIVYNVVVTNVGGAYNNQTGIFTAPVSGVYVFDFTLMVDPGKYQYLELVKDGVHVLWNYGIAASNVNSTSRTVTAEVKKGGQVWVRTRTDKAHGNGIIHGNTFTTFSGWLVAKTE